MFEALLAAGTAISNFVIEIIIEKRADKHSGPQSVNFIMHWNTVRFFGLMIFLGSVILWAPINPIKFVISYAIFYSIAILLKLVRYGIS